MDASLEVEVKPMSLPLLFNRTLRWVDESLEVSLSFVIVI